MADAVLLQALLWHMPVISVRNEQHSGVDKADHSVTQRSRARDQKHVRETVVMLDSMQNDI